MTKIVLRKKSKPNVVLVKNKKIIGPKKPIWRGNSEDNKLA